MLIEIANDPDAQSLTLWASVASLGDRGRPRGWGLGIMRPLEGSSQEGVGMCG